MRENKKSFCFEAEAKVPLGQEGVVSVWTDSISFSTDIPLKGERFPFGVPAFALRTGHKYRVTVEEIG